MKKTNLMRNFILIPIMLLTLGIVNAQNHKKDEYKISKFGDDGWITICITSGKSITIMLYANQNEYHKNGSPMYILQGTIGFPDKKNLEFGKGNPTAGPVKFTCLWVAPGKKDLVPNIGTIWYKSYTNGKDELEELNNEGSLNIEIAKSFFY